MTEETYRRLMLKHTAQQTNLLFGLFGFESPHTEAFERLSKIIDNLQDETDEALKEEQILMPDTADEPMRWW